MYKKNCLPQPVSIYCQAGVLQPMGSQRVRYNLATEQQQPMQSCFNIWKATDTIHCINNLKITLRDLEKLFNKNQNPFMIKYLRKVGLEGNFLKLRENNFKKPTAYIIVNGEKLEAFSLRSGTKKGCYLSPLSF